MEKTDTIKLLAIDDKPDNLTTLSAVVRDALPNTRVLTATNGPAGIELAATEDPDVILLDIVMPGMDGFEVCRRLKADDRLKDIPVIFLTALKTDTACRVKILEVGGDGFLTKPLETAELTAQIRAMTKVKVANRSQQTEKERLEALVAERTADLQGTLASLQESEERYRSLLDNLDAGVVVHAPDTSIIMNNPRSAELLGLSNEQMQGKQAIDPAWHFIKENGNPYLTEEYPVNQIVSKRQAVKDVTLGINRPATNDVVWFSVNGVPVFDCKGELSEIVISFVDITERKRAEAKLAESEERIRSVFASMTEMVVLHELVCDEDGRPVNYRILDCNLAFTQITGIRREDAVGRLATDVYDSDTAPYLDEYARVALTDEPCTFITSYAPMDKHFDIHASSPGKNRFVTVTTDITERKRAEDEFRASKDLLSETERIGKVGGWSFNIDTMEQTWTDEVYRIHEIEISPNPSIEKGINYYTKESRPIIEKAVQRAIELGEEYDLELEIITAKGNPRAVHTIGKADLNNRRIYGFFQDISERKQAEEALRRNEERIQSILRSAPVGIGTVSNRIIREINPRLCEITGYSAEELIDQSARMLYPGNDEYEYVGREKYRQIQEVGTGTVETRWKRKDGTVIDILLSSTPIDTSDFSKGVTFTALDITERKQAEDALREERERIDHILNITGTGIDIVDGNFNLHFVDRSWQKVYGDPTGCKCYEYFKGLSKPCPGCMIPTALKTKQVTVSEEVLPRENNRIVQVHIIPFQTAEGQWQVAEFNVDITVRKQAESELRRLSTAIDQSPETVVITDTEGTIQYVNPAFETITGYTSEEAIGQNPRILKSGKHDDAFYAEMWNTLLDGRVWEGRLINKRKDGSLYTEEASIAPVKDSNGTITNFVGIKRDITQELKSEEMLRQARKMESVGRLAGGVAHDFNNLLMGIMGYTELCRDKIAPDHPIRKWLDEITKQGERSADLTRQLLAFARKQTIAPVVLDLNDAVAGMLKMLRRLIGEDIDLLWKPGAELVSVKLDPGQVHQILVNLCVNARDAIGGVGKVTIETQNVSIDADYCEEHAEATPGHYVTLVVSDDGCGMDKETLEHVFDPFFTTKGVGEGTGLGLSTVYGIVKQNEGFLNVLSEPGHGTTFRIYLPRFGGEQSGREEAGTTEKISGGSETVLLVEDEKGVLEITAQFLEKLGYTLLTAGTPSAALQLAAKHGNAIDLLITDVVMPGMSGRDLAVKLSKEYPRLKCLFISGYTADVIAHRGVLEGGVHFLAKPFTWDDIARKVREVLKSERTTIKE